VKIFNKKKKTNNAAQGKGISFLGSVKTEELEKELEEKIKQTETSSASTSIGVDIEKVTQQALRSAISSLDKIVNIEKEIKILTKALAVKAKEKKAADDLVKKEAEFKALKDTFEKA